jgi:predicted RNase H-like nuclease (RuvC/YqgF family)
MKLMTRRQAKLGQPAHLEAAGRQQVIDNDEAIREALRKLEADATLPATQEMVAKLAGVSRGTLHNRKKRKGPGGKEQEDPIGALAWLKRIKAARKASGPAGKRTPEKDLEQQLKEVKAELTELEKRLKAARSETKRQFDKRVETERKYRKLSRRYASQSDVLSQLEGKLTAMGGNPGSVVMLRPSEPS